MIKEVDKKLIVQEVKEAVLDAIEETDPLGRKEWDGDSYYSDFDEPDFDEVNYEATTKLIKKGILDSDWVDENEWDVYHFINEIIDSQEIEDFKEEQLEEYRREGFDSHLLRTNPEKYYGYPPK